jgi:hypothetical protein
VAPVAGPGQRNCRARAARRQAGPAGVIEVSRRIMESVLYGELFSGRAVEFPAAERALRALLGD